MKVGILTLPLKGNYGGVLQAYALLQFLKENGHDAYLVDRQWDARKHKTLTYHVQKFVFHHIIRRKVMRFCEQWINPKTQKIDTQEGMQVLNSQGFEAFIVGSDQVWRVEHIGGVKNNYFLDFVKNNKIKKIAYAASFGKDSVDGSKEKLAEIRGLLQDFNAISVREASGVKLCKDIFKVDANHVLDPVLLVDTNVFTPIIKKSPQKANVLTAYVLDTAAEKKAVIEDVANRLALQVNNINYKKDPAKLLRTKALDVHNHVYPSVENWLSGFRDAEYIITDSFHGMMFSIAFQKQFIVIGNERRGLARFNSFLSEFNLLDRLVISSNPYKPEMVDQKIDYTKVNKKLQLRKEESRDFLLKAIQS